MDGSGRLVIQASRDDDVVVVRVSDTGPGIDPEVMNRIFDPFFTTKAPGQGTGLGLHTVHTIVNRTGGDIKAESGPEGTTFIITFPVV
jgi:signal transduction histidine kinase